MQILYPLLILLLVLTLLFSFMGLRSLRKRRPVKASVQLLVSLCLGLLMFSSGLLIFSTYGYQQLTYEEPIAIIEVSRLKGSHFSAKITFPHQRILQFQLSGDEVYVDARILKWHHWANLLGFHTLYKLDRIGGRYLNYEDEVNKKRSVYTLQLSRNTDLYDLRKKYPAMQWLVDAQYGSAAFIPVQSGQRFQLSVSNSGLILRQLDDPH